MYDSLLKCWDGVIQTSGLEKAARKLRWIAYYSDFLSNIHDNRFRMWVSKGLTTNYSLAHEGTFLSFKTLKQKYRLGQDNFYRYLQVRHYFDQNIKIIMENSELGFVESFSTLLKSHYLSRMISKLYKSIQHAKVINSEYSKRSWETEGSVLIHSENWAKMCQLQWTTTISNTW